ncbi:twin-arginine translocase subunit TatB [Marinobacterium sp. AK62]|uniref:Sec-independent protein translocase protein TatB n=1 Tax=Marinobacterium alkalitolerans TaxID=1542925 RepID=A0ABS3ZCP9_9GAMM|nr:Sec-independent protein translocase protein TatB [Marinobacterium alkalitolerans]MBP0049474.1 twin-arginine translocase subunit TatB [Marinobacterium alkalitolerans]
MFDIGFFELLVVGVVALLVLGPERLPAAARTCGLWLGRVRRSLSSIQSEIREELRVEELKRTSAIQKEQLDKELDEMRQPFEQPFATREEPKADPSSESSSSDNAEKDPQDGKSR